MSAETTGRADRPEATTPDAGDADAGVGPAASAPRLDTVDVDGAGLTVARWGDGPAEIVLLHDGLGSIGQWRTIPGRIRAETGRTVLAYDRPGHGRSTPVPTGAWPADWLHREADRFGRLLDVVGRGVADRPLLVGHSDGGSIALLHARDTAGSPGGLRGLVTLAAHSWVEQRCIDGIVGMVANRDTAVAGLARSHEYPAAVFDAWSGVWLSDGFRPWDVRQTLAPIACPTLVAQGRDDEYATAAHATDTAAAIGDNAEARLLDGVGHLLHHQDPELVVRVVARAWHEFG
ncbi:MAG: alpha/beta hydrolase [Actinomycetota bacterium]